MPAGALRGRLRVLLVAGALLLPAASVRAAPPAGVPERAPDLDARPGFAKPPPGYGVVPFFWWLGDPLTRERLAWILGQMEGMGVAGYQINYAHSDRGGRSWGLTYPSEPALFSEDWWQLVGWFMGEAKKQGAAVSLSDYTLGFGQGYMVDAILREHPEVRGQVLKMTGDGRVAPETVEWSLNPVHPRTGALYADAFFGQFERRFPGEGGKGLNFFFSDELGFGVDGRLWSDNFAAEFRRRKGYDLAPELAALFKDIGPRTPKVRLDYRDVLAALSEEGFFKPVYDWHQQRGMIMGCDHGGRGRNVVEFGDYFRTQRWNQGPGSDQPGLGRDLIKAKVAASIAHLYERPRVWLEGFYGSGWGTTAAGFVDATLANYAMGYNLLGIHGMYYSTHGGWWEWAPPDNTFRMPYWRHLRGFMDCQQRLAYLLSQGHHRCDVAILYPVAPAEADLGGREAVAAAFDTAQKLYAKGIDFDFIDFESVDRAAIVGAGDGDGLTRGRPDTAPVLRVAGEKYRVLVLPGMRAIRHSTLVKAAAFKRAGGRVLAVGALPEASDRVGRDDPEVAALVRELFPDGATADVAAAIPFRDYVGPGYVLHRRIGPRDVYAIYNAPRGTECFFRATGAVELWDPWTGGTRPLAVVSQTPEGTKLKLPLTEKEMQLIVFGPGTSTFASAPSALGIRHSAIPLEGPWEFELAPTLDNRFGDFHWPPTKALVGAEARRLKYAEETGLNPGWQDPRVDDTKWATATCGFGPRFWKLGPLPDGAQADAALAALAEVDPAQPVAIGGKSYRWQPYEFSWRYGLQDDCARQGYHGLKERVADEFIGLGGIKHGHPACSRVAEPGGSRYYLWTSVPAAQATNAPISCGGLEPARAWLNGAPLAAGAGYAALRPGANALLLRYDAIGRGWFVVGGAGPAQEPAGAGAAFSPAASWIWWPGETEGVATRHFRRDFTVASRPIAARLRITCDNSYRVSVNGRAAGSGSEWTRVQEYDVKELLHAGANAIEVEARNVGGEGGLIAELILRDRQGEEVRIGTDAQWMAAPARGAAAQPAQVVATFAESLWAKHELGPPRVDAAAVAAEDPQAMPWNLDLAMRWHTDVGRLPLDIRPGEAQPAGWYRFVSPPGLTGLELPTRGRVRAWADGQELAVEGAPGAWHAAVPRPTHAPVVVALRVEQVRGDYGGAAFDDYLRLTCGPGELAAGDWSQAGVLETYSGGAWYRKTVEIPAAREVVLDLGNVAASAEVRVNGKSAGIRVSPPWTVDVTDLVRPGSNRIEVLVCNTLANHYVTIPTHYRGDLASGLLGPVSLRVVPVAP